MKKNFDNQQWYNDIISVISIFDKDNHTISLDYKKNHKFISENLCLTTPFALQSAYSQMLKKILEFLKNSQTDFKKAKCVPPFENFNEIDNLNDFEV